MRAIAHVGMDVHKDSIHVAMLMPEEKTPNEWSLRHDDKAASRLARKFHKLADERVRCCYEAGPCGYGLQRKLRHLGIDCQVIAPSLIPVKPGERIKTDRRDAKKLARSLRAGDLTEVHPPTSEEEAVRDLCRAREDAQEDLQRSRHRLSKMLLRRALRYPAGRKAWTRAYHAWLRGLRFELLVEQAVFDDYLRTVERCEERVKELDDKLAELASQEPYAERVTWLRCFRGIETTTAMVIVSELHGFARFKSARELMAYLGLVPSEHSTGGKRRLGAITKTGNKHVRRILVEAAWHYRHPSKVSKKLQVRRVGQPGWVIAIADNAQCRLHRRYWRMVNKDKPTSKANVALARELVGFIWEVLYRQAAQQA